jgi:NodT family efflux transporter outer membrane factor (OMF) lipoprotein
MRAKHSVTKLCPRPVIPALVMLLLTACVVGPNYVKPTVVAPAKYKETPKGWKVAHPRDVYDRGPWWHMFHDKELNKLETQMNITNQNIEQSYEQFMQARALVAEARASFFPLVTGSVSVTRERQSPQGTSGTFVSSSSGSTSSSGSSTSGSSGTSTTPTSGGASTGAFSSTSSSGSNPSNSHSLFVDASWEPDIWGSVHRQVEASVDNAQASLASLESIRLSSQATLAQDYFELRALDNDQKILDDTVNEYKKALKLTSNEYKSGTAAKTDYILAKTQLETAEASALNNQTARAQFEHAIAVLIDLPPANFQILARPCDQRPPTMPVEVPSLLLERRPDVAQAERLAAQANAQIGVAISAYFPVLTLSATGNVTNPGFAHWFSVPDLSWSLGSQLAETLIDGGLRGATVDAARANYKATIANYRLTVLTAFQNVEDSLVSLRVLSRETKVQDQAATDAKFALKLVMNEYKAGTISYTAVIVQQNTTFTALQTASDLHGQQMTSAVSLIKALGGGWDVATLDHALS